MHDSESSQPDVSSLLKAISENFDNTYNPQRISDLKDQKIIFDPYYQRKYVWDTEKASFFIESLLKNCEIPPLILYRTKGYLEMVDGRQRFETIRRFINNSFKLNGRGLTSHRHLAGKTFDDLTEEQRMRFLDVTLRIYEYKFIGSCPNQAVIERQLKQEIFRRYNMNVTPLTQLEVFKAKYINDNLTNYLKNEIENNSILKDLIVSTFHIRPARLESILNKVRQLLVLHYMPIHSFSYKKTGIHKIYDYYADLLLEQQGWEKILKGFLKKLTYLQEIKHLFAPNLPSPSGQAFESLFWALSICQKQNYPPAQLLTIEFKRKLARYIQKELTNPPSYLYAEVGKYNYRFKRMASFFAMNTELDFDPYLKATVEFRSNQERIASAAIAKAEAHTEKNTSFLIKDPITRSVSALLETIQKNECSIRPDYQRDDVISRAKSSSIIESLLLGFRLPPIFIYTRKNGRSEVIDGQQRIISLLAFLGLSYTNEKGQTEFSNKNNFNLNLKDGGLLRELNGLKFKDLDPELQQKIKASQILIIEIKEDRNQDFDPVDLFMRLNFKPYPIKNNTFESWNSFADKRFTDRIKEINKKNLDWFYYTKANERMHNEELIVSLIYVDYMTGDSAFCDWETVSKLLPAYILHKRLHIRIHNKNAITQILKEPALTDVLLVECDEFEKGFLRKIRLLLNCKMDEDPEAQLDELLFSNSEGRIRTNLRFYLLWIILRNISVDSIKLHSDDLIRSIKKIFNNVGKLKRIEKLENATAGLWISIPKPKFSEPHKLKKETLMYDDR